MNLGVSYYTQKELETFGFKKLGKNVQIKKNTTIVSTENISIGDNTRIDDYCVLTAQKNLIIGSYGHICSHTIIRAHENVTIGDFVNLGNRVVLISITDDFSGDYLGGPMVPKSIDITKPYGGPVTINDHVWVGIGGVILPNCTINEGTAVGSLSLVNRDLKEWRIYLGNPVREIKHRNKKILDLGKKLK